MANHEMAYNIVPMIKYLKEQKIVRETETIPSYIGKGKQTKDYEMFKRLSVGRLERAIEALSILQLGDVNN